MTTLIQDLRYAVRQLGRSPGFTAVVVLTIALGIGANTAIFSLVNGVLLDPLPFPSANRIVALFQDKPNFPTGSISYPNFLDWQRENHSFAALAAYRWADGSITGVGEPERVPARHVSANFFPILGVRPLLGRNFSPDEDRRGANPTAMISEGLWKRKFASDPNVIGKTFIVGGESRTIVGIVPASFHLVIQNFRTADVYQPIGEETQSAFYLRDSFWGMDAIGLLKPGITIEQARDDLQRVNAQLAVAYPDVNANMKANIVRLKDEMVGDMRPVLLVLLGAVGFVLLIGCVNVANLLLARSTAREREFSVRLALGAAQSRILRQLLTESILLAFLGGALGLVLAKLGMDVALALVPETVPRAEEIGINLPVLLFTGFISILSGVLFGLAPALKTSHEKIGETLKEGGRAFSSYRSRLQGLLVITEMALALVLLIGAGLMLRTLMHLWGLDPGFDSHNVLYFDMNPPPSLASKSPDAIRSAFRNIDSTIRSIPGVELVSLHWGAIPMQSDNENIIATGAQQLSARQADLPTALSYTVEPDYLKTMRIPLLRGRFLSDQDNEQSARVCVIDRNFRQRYFAGQDPIGQRVNIFDFDSDLSQRVWIPMTVVGVVEHVNQFGLSEDASQPLQAQVYLSVMQSPDAIMKDAARGLNVFVRYQSPLTAEAVFQNIRKKLLAHNEEMILSGNESEDNVVTQSIASQRFSLALLGTFAGLALLLASVGIYGVLSYLVGQRTREIGVRIALGARPSDVMAMIIGDGAQMVAIGTVIGLAASLGLTHLMSHMLFGVGPVDPGTFASVAIALCAIALFTCYLPARRAARVDPIVALRYE